MSMIRGIHLIAIVACALVGCEPTAPTGRPPKQALGSGRLLAQGDRCVGSGGTWKPLLLTCVCPAKTLFYIDQGCLQPLPEHGPSNRWSVDIENAMDLLETPAMKVVIGLAGLSELEIAVVKKQLHEDWTRYLIGMGVQRNESSGWILKRVERASLGNPSLKGLVNSFWSLRRQYATDGLKKVSADPVASIGLGLDATTLTADCRASFVRDVPEIEVAAGDRMCRAVAWALERIALNTFAQSARNIFDADNGCRTHCTLAATDDMGSTTVRYVATMQQYTVVDRVLHIGDSNATSLQVFLSPYGGIEAVVVNTDIESKDGPSLIISRRVILGYQWDKIADETQHRGDRFEIGKLLESPRTHSQPLVTDGDVNQYIHTPIVGVIVDSGVDVQVPGLISRLNVGAGSFSSLAEGSFVASGRPIIHALRALVDDSPWRGSHGTGVTSVMVANLPNARLSFIHLDEISRHGASPRLGATWVNHIKTSGARVVNVSAGFDEIIGDCPAFFEPIFRQLPDVLFVFATGNDGARNPAGTCPSALARFYDNVVTVAGTDDSGHSVDGFSNYGSDIAKVAAPFRGLVAARGESGSRTMEGTSYSAPRVSNAALRLFARYPNLTAADVLGILMTSCTNDHLDVECGGSVDFSKVEAYRP